MNIKKMLLKPIMNMCKKFYIKGKEDFENDEFNPDDLTSQVEGSDEFKNFLKGKA